MFTTNIHYVTSLWTFSLHYITKSLYDITKTNNYWLLGCYGLRGRLDNVIATLTLKFVAPHDSACFWSIASDNTLLLLTLTHGITKHKSNYCSGVSPGGESGHHWGSYSLNWCLSVSFVLFSVRMLSIHALFGVLCWYIRHVVKWFLRKTTRLCELQRICYGEVSGAPRTLAVESSLVQSRNAALKELPYIWEKRTGITPRGALQYAVETVIHTKKINPQVWCLMIVAFVTPIHPTNLILIKGSCPISEVFWKVHGANMGLHPVIQNNRRTPSGTVWLN